MAHILFVCLHNAGRSQMSQALFERAAGGRHTAASAGTTPATNVHPEVVEAMGEVGIDLAGARPRRLTRELVEAANVVVTMGCGDQCPVIPGTRYIDWELSDPAGRPLEQVRELRDQIARNVDALLADLDADRNKALVRRLVDGAVNGRDPAVIDEIAGGPFAEHAKRWISPFERAFPDFEMELVELIAEGDKVVAHCRCSGTHLASWAGVPPTGRRFERVDEIYIFTVSAGRLTGAIGVEDNLTRLTQLGITLAPE